MSYTINLGSQSFLEVGLPYVRALRPRQWTKNLVVLVAPLFAQSVTWESISGIWPAFVLFCCASSSFYLINDIADLESDRRHPVKCKRPIASGAVRVQTALCMAIILLGGALAISWMYTPALSMVLLGYALLQVVYNLKLKHTPLLDILAIAMGFVLRACAGSALTGLYPSPWFLVCTAMFALFLAIEKRKAELRLSQSRGRKTRAVLQFYSLELLARIESLVTTGALMSYTLWCSGPSVNGTSTSWMLLTLPFVLYGVFRYQLLSDPEHILRQVVGLERGGCTERPEEVLLKDRPILVTVLSWGVMSFSILWLHSSIGL